MSNDICFTVPQRFDVQDVSRLLAPRYALQVEKPVQQPVVYYDTFDWRLFQKSMTLVRTATAWYLQTISEASIVARLERASALRFACELPPGRLRQTLAPLVENRALLPLYGMTIRLHGLRVLNAEAKTVARLCVEACTLRDASEPFLTCLRLTPVKGYGKHARRLQESLGAAGLAKTAVNRYLLGLTACQKTPGAYTSKLRLQLDPTMRADAASKEILRFLLHVMRQNEAGILQDIDSEFLHDFRVAVRRTRAALGQIKKVFPEPVTRRFREDFAYLGRITNRVRDLDVYLLHRAAYQAMLPEHLRPHIEPVFVALRQQRTQALHRLRRQLRAQKVEAILQRWADFLAQPGIDSVTAPDAGRPIIEVARQRLEKKHHAMIKLGRRLHHGADDQQLHALRIEAKKLRYLLEFFVSLFPGEATTALIQHLKAVQDHLGRLHDLYVQQIALHGLADLFLDTQAQGRHTVRAIDCLIGVLESEKQTLTQTFPQVFRAFASHTDNPFVASTASGSATRP